MFRRALRLPQRPEGTFFLWGPRQTGKTSLLDSEKFCRAVPVGYAAIRKG